MTEIRAVTGGAQPEQVSTRGDVEPLAGLPARVLYGAAYYAEYQPHDRLDRDLDLMAAAGLSVIRVGESVWSTWEPEDGRFDLEWLRPVLDGAHARGIAVILGTPTYAMPPWLVRKYPEVTTDRRTGRPIPYGHRQDADFTHPAFRFHARRIVRAIVGRYRDHPAVIGYQVDNEPGMELLHNRGVFHTFVDRLRERYGDVETLNERWGLVYWSHRISRWDELWTPDGNTSPSYDLAWRRFQADLTTEFIAEQAAHVRELARPDQFVTTCMALKRPAQDPAGLNECLDIAAVNPYYGMQDALALPPVETAGAPGGPSLPTQPLGPAAIHLMADMTFGTRRQPFLVTETNATAINESHRNFPAYDGQWRQAAWALVARGARMVEYWHWHSIHFGHETYWIGVIGHDGEPGRCYEEVKRIAGELAAAGPAVVDLEPDADVALLYSPESRWAMEFHPPLGEEGSSQPDRASYDRIFARYYEGLFAAGLQVAILQPAFLDGTPEELAERRPVLVVPALYIADEPLLDALDAYARAGGHLVLGIRTGYADEEARARIETAPGRLRDAAGVSYREYTNLNRPVAVVAPASSELTLPDGAAGTAWADALVPEGADVLAGYDDPHLGRWAAITSRAHERGRVTYVGTVPDRRLAVALARWLAPGDGDGWRARPASVTVTGARNPAGERLRFVSNWSWQPATVASPVAVHDLLSAEDLSPGDPIRLGAWDVRVLVERAP